MFLGVKAHHASRCVASYEDAADALRCASLTATGKSRAEKPYGYHLGLNRNHGVTWVRDTGRGIAFRKSWSDY